MLNEVSKLAMNSALVFMSLCCLGLIGCGGGAEGERPASALTKAKDGATIAEAELHTLVGMPTEELMERFGKPFSVSNTDLTDPTIESWHFPNKVRHEASGLLRALFCKVKDGKCIEAKAF